MVSKRFESYANYLLLWSEEREESWGKQGSFGAEGNPDGGVWQISAGGPPERNRRVQQGPQTDQQTHTQGQISVNIGLLVRGSQNPSCLHLGIRDIIQWQAVCQNSSCKRYHSMSECLMFIFWIWKISTRRAVSLNTFYVHLNVRLTYFDFSVFQQLNIEKVHVVTTKYACGITSISTGIHKVLVGYKCMSLSLPHYFALMFSPSLHVPFVYRWSWKVLTSSMIFVTDIQKLSFLLHIMD